MQLVFQFTPKVFIGFEERVLCRILTFFHLSILANHVFMELALCHDGTHWFGPPGFIRGKL